MALNIIFADPRKVERPRIMAVPAVEKQPLEVFCPGCDAAITLKGETADGKYSFICSLCVTEAYYQPGSGTLVRVR